MNTNTLDLQQQADNDALASAVGAAAHQLGLDAHEQHRLNEGYQSHQGIGVGVGVGVGAGQGSGSAGDDHARHAQHEADLANLDLSALSHSSPHQPQNRDQQGGLASHNNSQHHTPAPEIDPTLDLANLHIPPSATDNTSTTFQHPPYTQPNANGTGVTFTRPPSIRKACDLCHAAKQKCSGDRPTCTRCLAGGWQCHYAARQRRRTVPKELRNQRDQYGERARLSPPDGIGRPAVREAKKRKLDVRRNSLTFENGLDLKTAMGMALDMGMANEDEGEEILSMSNEAMLEVIAVDGYIADLPLATFVNNLPYNAPPPPAQNAGSHPPIGVGIGVGVGLDDYSQMNDYQGGVGDMDQHTTSALRDAIFSLNNDTMGVGAGGGSTEHENLNVNNMDALAMGLGEGADMDPHLALLDLSHIQEDGDGVNVNLDGLDETHIAPNNVSHGHGHSDNDHSDLLSLHLGCNHPVMVPHILALLVSHSLDPKSNSSTPLTMPILAPLARAIRTFHNIASCPSCSVSPQQTLPQLALISRVSTILTFPFPPTNSGQIPGAQIVLHGARLTGTGISDSIEQHIVHVVWDSWRASIREIFGVFERGARDVIAASAQAASHNSRVRATSGANKVGHDGEGQGTDGAIGSGEGDDDGRDPEADRAEQPVEKPVASSVEIQRAGLFFQAMSRLKQAMEEVEME